MAFDALTPATFAALTVDAPAMKAALALAGHVIEKRNRVPVLGAARLTAYKGGLAIAATDLDMALTVNVPADSDDYGQAVFPLPVLADAIGKTKGKVSMIFDGPQLVIEAGGATVASGDGFALDDFPEMSPDLFQGRAELPASVLLAALAPLLPCISTEETRYYLNGVFFHAWQATANDAPTLRLVATDGHRLWAV